MKLVWSALFKTGSEAPGKEGPVILTSAKELSSFSYFQRSSVSEMFTFFARTFANNKNLAVGARTSVKQQGFQCHMYISPTGVTAVCYADDEYPAREGLASDASTAGQGAASLPQPSHGVP